MSASNAEPIAIVGMGCRFPGGVESPGGLWQLAAQGRSTVGRVPAERWDAARLAACHDPEEAMRADWGCFLDGDVWAWDPQAFSVAPAEQRWVDPQFRLLMEVAWEAVEHAGIPVDRLRGSRAGVYVGTYAPDNLFREARPVEDAPNSPYLFGNFTAGAAGRVAFALDLRGPVMVISTHCSSGLVAVDTACGALTLGECDVALAGAVLLMLSPETHYYEAPLLLSRQGACHAFDARADGYVRGEGAGVLVLKRLADARRAGDRVLAVIRGSAVNNDGQSTRLTAPSTRLQQELFRETVAKAGIEPGEVGLVEAHGPGTAVGDPVEYTSIDAVYGRGKGRCALGSVKTNIGHSEPASGIAGIIKATECLRRGHIPPNLHFSQWNPAIERRPSSRLFVPTKLTSWPVPGKGRLAAVCSYGVTGTNAHLVLEAPLGRPRRRRRDTGGPGERARLFPLSGHSAQSLAAASSRLADWVEGEGAAVPLADVAHTLAVRRSHADQRLVLIARDHRQLAGRARAFAAGKQADGVVGGARVLPPEHAGAVFVFTGQGSQRPRMCQGLLADEPVFAAAVDALEPLIRAEAGFSLRQMIAEPGRLRGIERIQPVLFGVQVALARLWRSWGVVPAAVIGQSLGEVAAAVVAGVLAPENGVKIICRRSALLATISGGAMASVMLDAETVRAAIEEAGAHDVCLGVITSPRNTVISGAAARVTALVEAWNAAGATAKTIDVEVASHSPQVDPILDALRSALAEIPAAEPGSGFYSTVSADPRAPGLLDADYWVSNQRATVRFRDAVSAALADGHRLFIECTAHPLAVRPVLDTAQADGAHDAVAVGTLLQGSDDTEAFLSHLAAVHCAGYEGITWAGDGEGELADVPGTAWHRTRHGGDEPPYRLVAPHLVGAAQHPLLGGYVQDPDAPERHLWHTPVGPARLPWLGDHQVAGTPVLPGTGLAEMLLAAGAQVFGTDRVAVEDMRLKAPLVLEPEPDVTTRLVDKGDRAHAEVLTRTGDGTVVHAHATVRPLAGSSPVPRLDLSSLTTPEWSDATPADLYRHFRERHDVFHGPAFTAVDRIRLHPDHDRAVSHLRVADTARISAHRLRLHPALADELVQTVVAAWLAYCPTSPGPVVVAGIDEIRLHGPTGHTRYASVHLREADDLACTASGVLATADGTVVAEVRGLRLANITPPEQRYAARLAHLEWVPEPGRPAPEQEPTDQHWLVVAPEETLWADRLSALLGTRAASSRLLTHPTSARTAVPSLAAALDDPTGPPCTGVVLVLGGRENGTAPPTAARENTARAVSVIQQLVSHADPPRLWLVRRGDETALAGAGPHGLLRVAAFEHPELRASSIELDRATPLDRALDDLLAADQPITEIAWWHGNRYLARVRPGPGAAGAPLPRPVRPGAAYLVTGGLGGLGLLTVRWLAERGAARVVAVGRSAPSAEAAREVAGLRRSTAADIAVLGGDIADPATVGRAVRVATDGGPELRGIVHAAGVVEDATLGSLGEDLLRRVWRGKADGAWALHRATLDADLDFFAVYSSLASLIGSPGQAAYAAANAYLDALVAHRLGQGLPATGIHWGAWGRVGRGRHLARQGFVLISPQDGVLALERILTDGHRQLAYSPIDVARWTAPYPALRHSTLLADLLTGTGTPAAVTAAPVREDLLAADGDAERRRILEAFVVDQVRDILGNTTRHIGAHTSLVVLGLDSLGAVQLQQRLQNALKVSIKPGVIWVRPNAAGLADWLLEQLGTGPQPPASPSASRPRPGARQE
ncbi:type I polyketide synthase [Streptomyces caatingaensis]|uniref:type I polyketide synthase n=1 Tax=Streptomyces caatingaensis TaxID=1678637 RepID=UPI000A6615C0|nr:type I polyketide synthase [Streptomyces caatingaensis]